MDGGDGGDGYKLVREQGAREEQTALVEKQEEERRQDQTYHARGKQTIAAIQQQLLVAGDQQRTDSSYREALEMNSRQQKQSPVEAAAAVNDAKRASRWDRAPPGETSEPAAAAAAAAAAPAAPPAAKRSRWDQTPTMVQAEQPPPPPPPVTAAAPTASTVAPTRLLTRQQLNERALTDEELDAMLPSEGYSIVPIPAQYQQQQAQEQQQSKMDLFAPPERQTSSGLLGAKPDRAADRAANQSVDLQLQQQQQRLQQQELLPDLPLIRPEDMHYFGKLLEQPPSDAPLLTKDEETSRTIMILLLKIKNGLPLVRKQALRLITDEAPKLGAGPLFNQLLPLLMSPTLDDQERHLLVKVVDRVLFRLEDQVRPFAHKIFSIIAPLLVETDRVARLEGREIISNLAKACGLATMIATMRPDIDNPDEFVRNTTARALSVVASALGIQSMCPFLRAVCRTKKMWEARHTGIKVVQQISQLMGSSVLPHLNSLIECIAPGLQDEQLKIRTMTAQALSSLAEAAHPYGYESFAPVLEALWDGIGKHRGKLLASFIKCEASIIPLMDDESALLAVQRLVPVLTREFDTPDEETKKIVLKAVTRCAEAPSVSPAYMRDTVLPLFFPAFWVRRNALDKKNCDAVLECTCALAGKVGLGGGGQGQGVVPLLDRVVDCLKDESEPMRRMAAECIERMLAKVPGASAEISSRAEERLVDAMLQAFNDQTSSSSSGEDAAHQQLMLKCFVRVIESLGERAKPHLAQICAVAKWRLANKLPHVRMQAADLMGGLAPTLKQCGENTLMAHLGLVLYENLGEEFPEVLGSLLGALKQLVSFLGCEEMTPPIRDLLPRLTPILRNSNEKVAENLIDLIGCIADGGANQVPAREWMRICFDLLEILRSPKMRIRRVAINTFGFIARAVGPQDVLHTLLTNLRVQERQMRVCTTVAIAIVAENCQPFTVLPGLMNEYRTPDVNVQNGVLKALSFMLQYVGNMAVDYVYAITPLLQSALADRDHVHRQTACDAVKHLALGVAGRGCEDCLVHLLNFVFPNIFEQSPHVARAVLECVEALRIPLGPGRMLLYLLPGLFHPARQVRQVYWRLYNNLYVGESDALVAHYPRFEHVPVLPLPPPPTQDDDTPAAAVPPRRDTGYRRSYHEMFV